MVKVCTTYLLITHQKNQIRSILINNLREMSLIVQTLWGGEGGGGTVTLKYDFAHNTFWVDIVLIVKNLDGFQAN